MAEIVITVAVIVAESVIESVRRSLVAPVYLKNYKRNLKNLGKAMKKLEDRRDRVQFAIDSAIRQGKDVERDIQIWLVCVEDIMDDGELALESAREPAEQRCCKLLRPNLKKRYQLSRRAKATSMLIGQLLEHGKFDIVLHRPALRPSPPPTTRSSTSNAILEAIRGADVDIVGLYGMAGSGKTTLVRKVASETTKEKLYDVIVFVEVSPTPNIRDIQGQIADRLGLRFHEETALGRARRLCERLMEESKVLLILDDLWDVLDLQEVGVPFAYWGRGCKLVLTSRSLDVLRMMGAQRNFLIETLPEDEAFDLFTNTVGDHVKRPEFQSSAVEVVRACAGVPLAIVVLARALKDCELSEWKNVLHAIRDSALENIEPLTVVYSTIELSYNYLKNEELKSMFLLCGIMENASFEDLFRYVMGRLPRSTYTVEEAKNRVAKLVRTLKASSLLLDTPKSEGLSMNVLVRDVARSIASRKHMFTVTADFARWASANNGKLKNCTVISLHDITALPDRLECPQLEFFYLKPHDPFLKVSDDFFTNLPELRVLHLLGMGLLSLPRSLAHLVKLRTLCMSQCKLRDVAVIGELRELEFLSFHSSDIEKLPAEIRTLTELRLLDLSHCSKLKVITPNVISHLTQLQEIYMGNTSIQWEVEESNSASIAELKYLSHLTTLQIHGSEKLRYLFSSSTVNKIRGLQYLEICDCTVLEEIIVAEELREQERERLMFPELSHLKINDLENLRVFSSGGYIQFSRLKELELQNCPELKAFIFNDKVEFPELEILIISGMDNLKTIWDNQVVKGSFSNLRSLEIKDCQKLLTVFPSCICERLLMLESLTVRSCGLVEQIFDLQELTFDEIYLKEAPHLRELYIDHLPKLKYIWNKDPEGILFFRRLQKVTVFLCPILKNLFPASSASNLWELESLEVSECGVEGVIAEGRRVNEAAGRLLFPKLVSLQLHGLPELRTFYPDHTVEVSHLRKLGLCHCDKVEVFISESLYFYETYEKVQLDISEQQPFLVGKDFHSLEELLLSRKAIRINQQVQVPEGFFGSLKSLELNDDTSALEKLSDSSVLPLHMIQKFHRLEKFSLNNGSYKEICSCGKEQAWMLSQIKHLILSELCDSEHIWKPDSLLYFQNLEILEVRSCINLITLMPFSPSFYNLRILNVWGCKGLINLVTSSTAKSLVKLEKLEVFDCNIMTEVIKNEGGGSEKIIFRNLKSLSLVYLQNLSSFCSMKCILEFPTLGSLVVNECPKMKLFSEGVTSTPSLVKLELNWKVFEQSGAIGLNAIIQGDVEKRVPGREDSSGPSN